MIMMLLMSRTKMMMMIIFSALIKNLTGVKIKIFVSREFIFFMSLCGY